MSTFIELHEVHTNQPFLLDADKITRIHKYASDDVPASIIYVLSEEFAIKVKETGEEILGLIRVANYSPEELSSYMQFKAWQDGIKDGSIDAAEAATILKRIM